jgi:PAS domain-containing protein
MLGLYHLNALFAIQKDMFFLHDQDELCRFVLDECRKILYAELGSFFLLDPATGLLNPVASVGASKDQLQKNPCKMGTGICGWVAEHMQGVIIDNPEHDPRFFQGIDKITGIKTKNIIASPIHLRNKIIGVLELLNRTDSAFKPIDLDFLNLIAQQTAIALENARLYSEVSSLAAFKESMLESLTGGFIAINTDNRVTECNPSARLILQINPDDIISRNYVEAFANITPLQTIFNQFIQDKTPKKRLEFLWDISGAPKRIGYSTFLIVSKDSAIRGYGITFQDLSHLKK